MDLEFQRKLAYSAVVGTSKRLDRARRKLSVIEVKYHREKAHFESLDRKLAMTDGRYKKIANGTSGRTEKEKQNIAVKLTSEQIAAIAAKLGIEL